MTFPSWFGVSIYSVLLLIFIFVSATRQHCVPASRQKLFSSMIFLLIFTFAADCASRVYPHPSGFFPVSVAGTYLKFFLIPLIGLLWFRLISLLILERINKKWRMVLLGIFAANSVLVLTNAFTGAVFFYDALHIYRRGPLFPLSALLIFSTVAVTNLFIFSNRKNVERPYFTALSAFAVPPTVLGILQIFFYGLPLALVGVVFSLLNVFIYVQNHNIDVDYLTGVYNRRKLDVQLHTLVRLHAGRQAFSAILLDLDDFKKINDTFGHHTGDLALEDAAAVLRQSVRDRDFVARCGGDEFCILLSISDPDELARVVRHINRKTTLFNAHSGKPYRLGFSIGCAVYEAGSNLELSLFEEKIDKLMYEDKRRKKAPAKKSA